jgi:hypothetical protein
MEEREMNKSFLLLSIIILIGLLTAGCTPPVEAEVPAASEEDAEEVAEAEPEEGTESPINVACHGRIIHPF